MNFIRINNRFINLDLVTDVIYSPSRPFRGEDHDEPTEIPASCRISYAVSEGKGDGDGMRIDRDRTELRGAEAEDFVALLDSHSHDAAGASQEAKA